MRILVTGATDGIGQQTALELARRGEQVVIHGRSADRIAATRRRIARETGSEPDAVLADLSSMAAVRAMASAVVAGGPIDVVVHNAGGYSRVRHVTVDGFEQTFAVNHLAPFLLTHLLLPGMPRTGRVLHVSSGAHAGGRIAWDDPMGARRYDGWSAYCQSKLAQVLFSAELARRLPRGPVSNALHPGVVGTKLLHDAFGGGGSESVEEGAETSVWLATAPDLAFVSGGWFTHRRRATPAPQARDPEAARRLYALSADLVGVEELPEP